MIKILEKLLNLIFTQPCYLCNSTKDDNIICSKCYNKIHFLPPDALRVEKNTKIYACTLYDEMPKKLIRNFKYHGCKILANVMAKLMFDYFKTLNINENFTVIAVPIHKSRLKERQYNHMDIAAKEFCYLTKFKYEKDFLLRVKDTVNQYKLNRRERLENIKDAFIINSKKHLNPDTNILLIDDITSTGATLKEIIKVLNKGGYKNITALVFSTPDIWN